jgi:hypothetical protein
MMLEEEKVKNKIKRKGGKTAAQEKGMTNRKFWEELIVYFPSIPHGSHTKRRVQPFFYCCVCIHCLGDVFTEPLHNNHAVA